MQDTRDTDRLNLLDRGLPTTARSERARAPPPPMHCMSAAKSEEATTYACNHLVSISRWVQGELRLWMSRGACGTCGA